MDPAYSGEQSISGEFSHSLAPPFGGLGLFLFFLHTWLVIESPLLDLREEAFLGQLFLEVLDFPLINPLRVIDFQLS